MRNLDAVAARYGKLPHSFIAESENWDDYQRYCFDEAIAIAGLSSVTDTKAINGGSSEAKPPEPEFTMPNRDQGAIIGKFNNVPFIRGTVPVRKRT